MKKLLALFICLSHLLFAEIPEPYRSINDLPFDKQGWFSNGAQLKAIIAAKSPKTVIEVGSWLGTSTRFIASHLPKKGIVYASQ
jgi:predicted O-methyltransferase YrrM